MSTASWLGGGGRPDHIEPLVDVHCIQFRHERMPQMGLKLTPLEAVPSVPDLNETHLTRALNVPNLGILLLDSVSLPIR